MFPTQVAIGAKMAAPRPMAFFFMSSAAAAAEAASSAASSSSSSSLHAIPPPQHSISRAHMRYHAASPARSATQAASSTCPVGCRSIAMATWPAYCAPPLAAEEEAGKRISALSA